MCTWNENARAMYFLCEKEGSTCIFQVLLMTEEMETMRCDFRQRLEEVSKPVQPNTDLSDLINTQLEEIARYPLENITLVLTEDKN